MIVHWCAALFLFNTITALTKSGAPGSAITPKITYSKQTASSPDKDVKLDCGVEGVDLSGVHSFNIMWTKYDTVKERTILPITSGETVLISPQKYKVIHPKGTYQYSLSISKLEAEDSGTYRCTVDFGEDQKIDADVPLIVNVPAHFSDDTVKTVIVTEGDAISIDCQPHGFPLPKVFWEKVGSQLPHYGGDIFEANQLDLPLISRTHRGNYRCFANNGLGKTVSSEIIIDVEFKPSINVDEDFLTSPIYGKVNFSCQSQGNPIPEIVWLRKGESIINSVNRRILSRYDSKTQTVSSILTLNQAQPEDFGEYTCAAANSQGTTLADLSLELESPPIIVKSAKSETIYIRQENNIARNALPVALQCEATAYPHPNYRWVKDRQPLIWQADPRMSLEDGTGTLIIENPTFKDNGIYQCFAYNNLGVAASDLIHLMNDTEIQFNMTGHEQTDFEAEIGKPFALLCPAADSIPKPVLTWAKAHKVPDGLKIEFFNSKRAVVDPTGTLWFTHITEEDDTYKNKFEYLCLATTYLHPEDLSLAKTVKLKALPSKDEHDIQSEDVNIETFLLFSSSKEVIFKSTDENRLWCIFGGEPSPIVTWERLNGEKIDTERLATENFSQTLIFRNTLPSDAGKYQCSATNGMGEVKTAIISVQVQIPPKFTSDMKNQSQVVHEGATVTFVCGIHNDDATKYEWYFNTQLLHIAQGSKRILEGNKLTIQSVSMADIGNYACNASNAFGYSSGQAVLNVIPMDTTALRGSATQITIKNLREDVEKLRFQVEELSRLIKETSASSVTNEAIIESINQLKRDINMKSSPISDSSASQSKPRTRSDTRGRSHISNRAQTNVGESQGMIMGKSRKTRSIVAANIPLMLGQSNKYRFSV